MDVNFAAAGNVYGLPVQDPAELVYPKNVDSMYMFDYNNFAGFDAQAYAPAYNLSPQALFPGQNVNQAVNPALNTDMTQNMLTGTELNQTMMGLTGHEVMNGVDLNGTYGVATGFENGAYVAPEQYFNSSDQYGNLAQFYKPDQFNGYVLSETSLVEPRITFGDSHSSNSSTPSYSYNYQPESYPQLNVVPGYEPYACYAYAPAFPEGAAPAMAGAAAPLQPVQSNLQWNEVPLAAVDGLSGTGSLKGAPSAGSAKDELESVANASTCESTPVLTPSPAPSNSHFQLGLSNPLPAMADQAGMMNMAAYEGGAYANLVGDMSATQLVNGNLVNPAYFQDYYNQTFNGYSYAPDAGYFGTQGLTDTIIEIANEIANNVQYLPDKDSNGKYSLDKNHPIHCVWRDVNRGHCSWRCRWWENGKRLSKNFNVKRFGEFEAMRMAITMKIRNSTPMERIQLLKEQREAVRNNLSLYGAYPLSYGYFNAVDSGANCDDATITKVMSDNKKLQRENWNRLSWTYLKTHKLDNSKDSTIVCRLCSKTTRCSRSRNLQQAHIMHLIRMHKNPWKQYIDPNGLTKMCKLALDALYQQHHFDGKWTLRPGIQRPEPTFFN